MNLANAKKVLIDFQVKHENYLNAVKQYEDYKNLPFWKKWVTKSVEAPRRDYLYEAYPIYRSIRGMMAIELRMRFSGAFKEITLAINEGNRGYILNVDTKEKSYFLGRVNPVITEAAEEILESIREELAHLIIE